MMKTIFCLLIVIALCACSSAYKEELYKTDKSSAAQGRIGASQAGSDSIFNDVN